MAIFLSPVLSLFFSMCPKRERKIKRETREILKEREQEEERERERKREINEKEYVCRQGHAHRDAGEETSAKRDMGAERSPDYSDPHRMRSFVSNGFILPF